MKAVLDRYEQQLKAKGNKSKTWNETMRRLRVWHKDDDLVLEFSPKKMKEIYAKRCSQVAVDSHRNELSQVKTFWRWAVKCGLVLESSADSIEPVGRRKRGKPMLRWSEASRLIAIATEKANEGDEGALAVLMAVMLGLRSDEIRSRTVRDVDIIRKADPENPKNKIKFVFLWISDSKTEAGTRQLSVAPPLDKLLRRKVAKKLPDKFLLPSPSSAGYRGSTWMRKNTARLCRLAAVPVIPPHGLRGTHSNLAEESGSSSWDISLSMGHADRRMTMDAYLDREVVENARIKRALRVVK